jgi:peptidoglycan/LPS O-acetylase OafA/YrhL
VAQHSGRYEAIDGWRGLAALGVVLTHVTRNRFGVENEWPVGHECVLLFFVISGYCITASSEATRSKGFRDFMRRRIRRIYPPYAFALAFYAATRFAKLALRHAPLPANWTALGWLQNLTLTQWLSMLASPGAAPWHNPVNCVPAFWSLPHEEQFYVVSGLLILAAPVLRLWTILAMMLSSLAWIVVAPWFTAPVPYHGFFLEMWVYFGIGAVVFYRLCRVERPAARRIVDGALIAAAVVAVAAWLGARATGAPDEDALRHLVVVTSFALLLIALRPLDAGLGRSRWFRPFRALGMITYSLYLVHQFNVVAVAELIGWFVPNRWLMASLMAQVAVHVGIAAAFWRLFERPFLNPSSRAPHPSRR